MRQVIVFSLLFLMVAAPVVGQGQSTLECTVEILDLPDIAGCYDTPDGPVLLYKQQPTENLPEGYAVRVVGEILPLSETAPPYQIFLPDLKGGSFELCSRKEWCRPAPGGISVGHLNVTAGTLGTVVYDEVSGAPYGLSNNHVLANENLGQIGDAIVQPGFLDGGRAPNDQIGTLARFIPIRFEWEGPLAVNTVDAALLKPLDPTSLTPYVLQVGYLRTTIFKPNRGARVCKSGRTTGLTCARVLSSGADLNVDYRRGEAKMIEQILTERMSSGGDSGSIVFDPVTRQIVGLLFAGNRQVTVINPIESVLAALNVTLDPGVIPPRWIDPLPFPAPTNP